MTTLGEARTSLFTALDAALTGSNQRVTATPIKPGSLTRYETLVTLGAMSLSPDLAELELDIGVQIGIGPSIGDAFDTMDTVLDTVNTALPVAWELPDWTITVDQDDQVALIAQATLRGHRVTGGSGVTWSESGVQWSQSGITWTGN